MSSFLKCIFDIKVVYIHPCWPRICLPPTFDYPRQFPDSLEAQKWPKSTKNDNFSKIKKLKNPKMSKKNQKLYFATSLVNYLGTSLVYLGTSLRYLGTSLMYQILIFCIRYCSSVSYTSLMYQILVFCIRY